MFELCFFFLMYPKSVYFLAHTCQTYKFYNKLTPRIYHNFVTKKRKRKITCNDLLICAADISGRSLGNLEISRSIPLWMYGATIGALSQKGHIIMRSIVLKEFNDNVI